MRTTFEHEDFLDFYYNGKWASELGLIKVNNGKRQDDEVLPASKDTSIDIPGNDGVYYVNSKYQQREFKVDFAYDGLSEDDIKGIREWLAPQKECRLIFSEHPYKYYMAKPKSAPKLSYIAFDANDGNRVYKGEGSVQFVCYYPWARSVATKKDDLEAFFNNNCLWLLPVAMIMYLAFIILFLVIILLNVLPFLILITSSDKYLTLSSFTWV